jgi:hypothetical protein
MSLRELRAGRALMLRLVLAEVLAKRGEGPLAPRFSAFAKTNARAASPPLASPAKRREDQEHK